MLYDNVKHLYKYTLAKRVIEILKTEVVYFPTIKELNDPFDSALMISSKIENKGRITRIKNKFVKYLKDYGYNIENEIFNTNNLELKKLYDTYVKSVIVSLKDVVNNASDEFGILSLSGDSNNQLLWAHYANGHKGVIIEYERSAQNKFGQDNLCFPVRYTSYLPEIDDIDIETDDIWKIKFGIKSDIWAYEKEWRLLAVKGKKLYDIPGKIESVTCGINIEKNDLEEIRKLCIAKNIKLYTCIKIDGLYSIKKQQV
jgi:hypothetical protein